MYRRRHPSQPASSTLGALLGCSLLHTTSHLVDLLQGRVTSSTCFETLLKKGAHIRDSCPPPGNLSWPCPKAPCQHRPRLLVEVRSDGRCPSAWLHGLPSLDVPQHLHDLGDRRACRQQVDENRPVSSGHVRCRYAHELEFAAKDDGLLEAARWSQSFLDQRKALSGGRTLERLYALMPSQTNHSRQMTAGRHATTQMSMGWGLQLRGFLECPLQAPVRGAELSKSFYTGKPAIPARGIDSMRRPCDLHGCKMLKSCIHSCNMYCIAWGGKLWQESASLIIRSLEYKRHPLCYSDHIRRWRVI